MVSPVGALMRSLRGLGPGERGFGHEAATRPSRSAAPGGAAEVRRLVDKLLADPAALALPPVGLGAEDTGGRTCSRPTSRRSLHRTLTGNRSEPLPLATRCASGSTRQRSHFGQ